MISFLLFLPLLGVFFVFITPKVELNLIKSIGLFFSTITLVFSTSFWFFFDHSTPNFQFVECYNWSSLNNFSFCVGIDGISIFFVILTTLLVPLCLISSFGVIRFRLKEFVLSFILLELFVLIVFVVLDLVLFYVFFESVLLPMFIIIGIWGSRQRKVRAAYFFFIYTLFGSVLMLLAILIIYFQTGSTDIQLLFTSEFSESRQLLLWLGFFLSFAAKVPMLPVHIWLPESHVEAPTAGSVILAGVLLKIGSYGLVRFSLPLFPYATVYFTPFVYCLCALAVIYTSLTAIRQSDIKRIIAYSSVAHMNLILIGLFSLNSQGVEGSLLQMLSHGLVSSALFLCVGVLYDRHHSRLIKYYGGLAQIMPIFATIFIFFTMSNIAIPGTASFIGEFLILAGIFQTNVFVCILGATGMVLGGAYSLWLFNRIVYGDLKTQYISYFIDLKRREFFVFLPLLFLSLLMGFYPSLFLDPMHCSVSNLIEHLRLHN